MGVRLCFLRTPSPSLIDIFLFRMSSINLRYSMFVISSHFQSESSEVKMIAPRESQNSKKFLPSAAKMVGSSYAMKGSRALISALKSPDVRSTISTDGLSAGNCCSFFFIL